MGRGRQKAKATRQAREMKYFSPETDYSALERELSSAKNTKSSDSSRRRYDDEDDYSAYGRKVRVHEDRHKRSTRIDSVHIDRTYSTDDEPA